MLLIIVYVGAVAVLFLFVVMMLDVDFASLKAEMSKYLPLGLLIVVVLLMELAMGLAIWVPADGAHAARAAPTPSDFHNTAALGLLLYDKYFLLFQLAGLILLVAMIGSITLTLREKEGVKKQNINDQNYLDSSKAIEKKKKIWENLSSKWKIKGIEKTSKLVSLENLIPEIEKILSGNQIGRIVLEL